MAGRIEDYALIGDCETAALVCNDGSIDWLCWPRFDSAACFAALLGNANNGRWQIAPAVASRADANVRVQRRYLHDTLILETEFTTSDGSAAVLIDFMPLRQERLSSHLVRLVVGKRGTVQMRTELIVRFGYGGWVPWVTQSDTGALLAIAGPDAMVLRTPVELRGEGLTTVGDFAVSAGRQVPFVLTYGQSHLPIPEPVDAVAALQSTKEFWQSWAEFPADRRTSQWDRHPLADHVKGFDLCTDGRHRCRTNHIAARAVGWRAQLGLPLLLAARRDADIARAHEWGILRRGAGLA